MGKQKKNTTEARQVRISNTAINHIDEITGYIAFIKSEPLNAIKIGDAIFHTIDRIAKNPLAFRECEQLVTLSKMYRQAACFSWSIIYRVTRNEILILGIIHQSRKPAKLLALRKLK